VRNQFDALAHDIRFALRQLRRSPGFAAVAIISLAIGIGATVTIYSAANALLRRQPDAARAEQLVRVYRGQHSPLPRAWFFHFAANSETMRALIAEDLLRVGLATTDVPERALASVVSENFFRDLGVGPHTGRVFAGAPGEPIGAVAVLSHRFWASRFGSDPAVVGHTIRINGQPFTVVGVAREGFHSSQLGWAPDLFVPLTEQGRLRGVPYEELAGSSLYVTGRLAAAQTARQAEAEILSLAHGLSDASEELTRPGAFRVEPARGITAEVRVQATVASAFLMLVVGLVLCIVCANLANLLLARAVVRRREIAVRISLGVTRGRLVRQLLTESIAVAAVGGAAGVALAYYATGLIPRLIPAGVELILDLSPDRAVLAFAAALTMATGVLFGLAPALRGAGVDVQSVLRTGGSGASARRSRLRNAFLIAQVGMATVLLVSAGLFLEGIGAARSIDPGFRSDRVADLPIDLSLRQYDAARGVHFYDELLRRVRDVPAVQAATLIRFVPLTGSNSGTGVALPSADPNDRSAFRGTTFTSVAPGYFAMFGIPVVRGRALEPSDDAAAPAVAVANESFARMMWPDGEPVGQAVRFGDQLITIVGVVPDTKYLSLNDRGEPFLYLPYAQQWTGDMVLQVRLATDAPDERAAVRAAVQAGDPGLPLGPVTSMADDMRLTMIPARVGAVLLSAFGLLALFLAAIGVYGVTSYLVGQRTAEIGIRAALGATPTNVLWLMMRETMVLVLFGLGGGLAGGMALGMLIAGWLYGIGPLDPRALGGASAVLLVVALVGIWLPARRALRIDPLTALRAE
jgi:putative ABC transport system permease protein